MIDTDAIQPGFITGSCARAIKEAIELAEKNKARLDILTDGVLGEFPAVLTAYDSTTKAFTWVQQAYRSNGARYIPTFGLSGGPKHNPAYGVGNGVAPITFPVEVDLIPTVAVSNGMAYEFSMTCFCGGATTSGSG